MALSNEFLEELLYEDKSITLEKLGSLANSDAD